MHVILWSVLGVFVVSFATRLIDPCGRGAALTMAIVPADLAPCTTQSPNQSPVKASGANAVLILTASPSIVREGSMFTVELSVNPSGTAVNLVHAALVYPTTSVKLIAKDESMSPFAIHLGDLDKEDALGEITQVQPNPGINQLARIARFAFTALQPGTISIGIASGSKVLANDGYGTDVLGFTRSLPITILR